MRKIVTIGIVAVLLCSVIGVIVQAQSIPTYRTSNVNDEQNIASNDSIVNERMAIAQMAIDDYLSGKTKTLDIPGAKKSCCTTDLT